MFLDVLKETVIDSLKLLPFLFAVYLAIEIIEDRAEEKTVALVHRAGRWGPVLGGVLGVVPQCGFSAATSNLYAGGIITRGTLLAVFLSTSDEMLPILISTRCSPALWPGSCWTPWRKSWDGYGIGVSTSCASRRTATARTAS